jgi:hypothetical protein
VENGRFEEAKRRWPISMVPILPIVLKWHIDEKWKTEEERSLEGLGGDLIEIDADHLRK